MSKSAEKILNTAEQLFYVHSINAVGVDLIRDLSGCSKTTMYTYFKNKQHLVESVLLARDQKFRASLLKYIADATGQSAIEKILDWHIQWFKEDDYKGCLFVRAVAESDADPIVAEIALKHKMWIKTLIAEHCHFGADVEILVELIYTLLEGMISRFLIEGYSENQVKITQLSLNKIITVLS